ncbi:MAG: AI-2E family transporter [Dehalococcoidia bacterium]
MTPRRWRAFLWLTTLAVTVTVMWVARSALLPFAVGAVVAYAISPLVDRLASVVPVRGRTASVLVRGTAVIVIYFAFFGSVVAGILFVVPVALNQVNQFVQEVPNILASIEVLANGWIEEYERVTPVEMQARIEGFLDDALVTAVGAVAAAAQRSFLAVTQTLGLVIGFAIVPFWMFYAIRDRHFITANVMRGIPPRLHDDTRYIGRMTDSMLGRYIRGQLFLGLVVGVAVGVAMTALGVQMSLALGVWAGLTELVPILGPWLGAIPGLIVVLVTEPQLLPWAALTYFLVQQAENSLLLPRVQGQALDLHPVVVITLIVIGGAVWGFIGIVAIVPFAAILRELFWYADRRLRGESPAEAFAASHAGALQRDLPLDRVVDEPERAEVIAP